MFDCQGQYLNAQPIQTNPSSPQVPQFPMLMGPQPHHQLLGRYATASTVTSGYPLQPRFAPLQVQPPPLQITSKCPPLDPVTVPPNASCQPAFSTFMSRVSTPSAPHQQNQHSNTASANLIAAAVAAAAASNTTSSPPVVAVRDSQWLKLTVCQPYLRELMAGGQVAAIPTAERCPLTADTCPLAHPQPHVRIENDHVTVCYDFMKRNECRHPSCKYYHPPKHQVEIVLKRGDVNKKIASQGAQSVSTNYTSPPQASLAGFCWPAGAAAPATPTSPMVPGSSPNPAAMAMALAAIRGGTAASLYAAAAAGSPAMPTGYPPPADPSGLTASLMAAGFYSLPTGAVSPIPASLYNPVEFLTGGVGIPATTSAMFVQPPPSHLQTQTAISPGSSYAAAVTALAAANAVRQAAAVTAVQQHHLHHSPTPQARNGESMGRKREAGGASESWPPSKRANTSATEGDADSIKADESSAASAVAAAQSQAQAQMASSLAFNAWFHQQQQLHPTHLNSPPPPPPQPLAQSTHAPPPAPTHPAVVTSPNASAIQAAALLRLQQQQQQQQVQQQQQQQQQWAAAMTSSYGPLAGLVGATVNLGYSNPATLFDPLGFQTPGLAATPYAANLLQNQTLLTNVAYINDEGQLLESLPICRDFKAGKCHRNSDCRYVHLIDENVEVNQGRVTVCRDAAKGRCTRVPCKYYHIPLLAISASRSLALNSALSAAAASAAAATAASNAANNNNNASVYFNGTAGGGPSSVPPISTTNSFVSAASITTNTTTTTTTKSDVATGSTTKQSSSST